MNVNWLSNISDGESDASDTINTENITEPEPKSANKKGRNSVNPGHFSRRLFGAKKI